MLAATDSVIKTLKSIIYARILLGLCIIWTVFGFSSPYCNYHGKLLQYKLDKGMESPYDRSAFHSKPMTTMNDKSRWQDLHGACNLESLRNLIDIFGKIFNTDKRMLSLPMLTVFAWTSVFLMPQDAIADNLKTFSQSSFSFIYPNEFISSDKPVKTHQQEVLLKSPSRKGYTIGITVDPVKLDNINRFATPEQLAKKVEKVEREKDGVISVSMLNAEGIPFASDDGSTVDGYRLEYSVESTRGNNHYVVGASIRNKQLFVLTAQFKEDDLNSLKDEVNEVIKSLHFNN